MTKFHSSVFTKPCEWHDETGSLVLHFKGGVYHIPNAPRDLHEKMQAAKSQGQFYNAEIKGKFDLIKGAPGK